MGELYEVLGALRFTALEACPTELREKTVKLRSKEGDVFEVPAEAACVAGRVRRIALHSGTEEEIPLPLRKATLAKVAEYLKHHKDNPAGEIVSPLAGDDLVECGATRWDAKFVDVDKNLLFDLNLAASLLDIGGMFFLTSAKAALFFKDKSADKLRKEFNLLNDLPAGEQEAMGRELKASGKARQEDANADIAALAVTLQATAAAAEKHGVLDATRTEAAMPVVDPRSWRHACWRAAVLLDWKQLAIAPEEVRRDRDLILGALMTSQGAALSQAAPELRADRQVVLEATKYAGTAFRDASAELRGDRGFVLEAVAAHGAALASASEVLRRDRGLVMEAARRGHGSALQGAAKELRGDPDFVLEVATEDPQAFRHASEELRNDRQFALRLAARCGRALQYMAPKFKADSEVVAAAVGENVAAALFAHSARRSELGLDLPWDSQAQLKEQYVVQTGGAGLAQAAPTPGGKRMLAVPFEDGQYYYRRIKLQKSIQFSAMSTMMGNMGQANYTAANIYLDKLPSYQRPEIDATTLMWGAVGNIGMRWKAFASMDMLNATPEALLTIADASKVLTVTCTKMEAPEWYAASFMDLYSRQAMLTVTSGMGSGGGWKPSEDQGVRPVEWRADGLGKGFLLGKDLDDERVPAQAEGEAQRGRGAPLGGWPSLVGAAAEPQEAPPPTARTPRCELELGARVQLVGLSSKNGTTGILVKSFADGKWKVRLEDGSGNALLKGCYLEAIQPPSELVTEEGDSNVTAQAEGLRHARLEERRCRLKARTMVREEARQPAVASAA